MVLTSMAILVSLPSIYFDGPCAKCRVRGWGNEEDCNVFPKCSQSSDKRYKHIFRITVEYDFMSIGDITQTLNSFTVINQRC